MHVYVAVLRGTQVMDENSLECKGNAPDASALRQRIAKLRLEKKKAKKKVKQWMNAFKKKRRLMARTARNVSHVK